MNEKEAILLLEKRLQNVELTLGTLITWLYQELGKHNVDRLLDTLKPDGSIRRVELKD